MDLTKEQKKQLLNKLLGFISDHKNQLFDEIIQYRTRYLTVVLEDIYQPQNASAVLRTADCFGIQDVHIIENRNEYIINPEVALGASKWLTLHRYNESENNTLKAIQKLKAEGYRIVATLPHTDDIMLSDLDMDKKTALFFGTELKGLSKVVQEQADVFVKIPMYGFTESYNISVSAALCLQELSNKMRTEDIDWKLSESEILDVKLDWARAVVKEADNVEKTLFSK
ncbi:MAG: RNA methyltransferase [Bacteroidales bacterium]|nr:RNA methyltransferase [Bacteroidales bacterium]RLD38142.1 MAG: TrmH family RNA methyltransferase [Bacteroidota bacterium]